MSLRFLFWLLMLLWLLFGFVANWPTPVSTAGGTTTALFYPLGGHLLHFALFSIVGVKLFGLPVSGTRGGDS